MSSGIRTLSRFNADSPFFLASGPYDFAGLRYFFLTGAVAPATSPGGRPRPKRPEPETDAEAQEEWVEDEPEPTEAEAVAPPVTVKIMAEDGKAPAPKGILPGVTLRLKAVPNRGAGSYSWKAKGKALRIENAGSQSISLTLPAGSGEEPGGFGVELVFTPEGRSALPPVTHSLVAIKALFMGNDGHPWGYDEFSPVDAKDHNWRRFKFEPESKLDFLSVAAGKTGLVDLHYAGAEGPELFLKPTDPSLCECRVRDAGANPLVVEVKGSAVKYKEARIEARYGGPDGPVLAELAVAVLKPVLYKAKYFRVEDPDSPGTNLEVAATPAQFEEALRRNFKSGAAEWRIEGEAATVKSKYDIIRNGALDIEPGADSDELKRLMADCVYKGTRIVHVHQLRWSYFLAADAGPKDTRIRLKDYGRYLDFVGTNEYLLEDTAGVSVRVKIKSADRAKGEFELAAPLGVTLKASRKAALIWPLGGLSGDPTLVSDFGGHGTLIGIVAHELGHSNAGLKDTAAIPNIMHGVAEGNEGVRGRPLPLFYHPDKLEQQWERMPGRT